ncbi:MAG: rod shape-determining protein RodA [Gammaproteobacteria bacterium]|nr:rod shape-determining protein RodA [Gammaproteobacteria bacterium]NNC66434.1 rod shape-determining protein RodA [Gammaproteobacteria bacterium]
MASSYSIRDSLVNSPIREERNLFNIDPTLFISLVLLCTIGLAVLYSATSGEMAAITRQSIRFALGFAVLIFLAQIPAKELARWSPWLYLLGIALLLVVMMIGYSGKGAQRWIDLGVVRFQPSELLKIFLPMMVAWYFSEKPMPPTIPQIFIALIIIAIPAGLVLTQPDLGTALLIAFAGICVIFLAGITWRLLAVFGGIALASMPVFWFYLHDYQRQRILTMLNPESDPLGTGYHIIQSKIAIGSGGVYGKGWLNGTQSQLDFIPERSTDFIFAVFSEEFGFLGVVLLLCAYGFIVMRGLTIAARAKNTYSRLLAGSLSLSFFAYFLVNIGMVSGLLPVVGVPLPLISYGGTSAVTLLAAFGILMSIHSHRKFLSY